MGTLISNSATAAATEGQLGLVDGPIVRTFSQVGRTTTPGAGEIGEDLSVSSVSNLTLSDGSYIPVLTSQPLSNGVYLVSALCRISRGESVDLTRVILAFSGTGVGASSNSIRTTDYVQAATTITPTIPAQRVIVNDTGVLWSDGAQSTSNVIILNAFHNKGGTADGIALARLLSIVRIA